MPDIQIINDNASFTSTTASSILIYDQIPRLRRRRTIHRLSKWVSRQISWPGLGSGSGSNMDMDMDAEEVKNKTDKKTDVGADVDVDVDANTIIPEEEQLYESYAAYCHAFTTAGQRQRQLQQPRKTKMMFTMMMGMEEESSSNVNPSSTLDCPENVDPVELEEAPETMDLDPLPLSPPPKILTPSLYAEMRLAAREKKREKRRELLAPLRSLFFRTRPGETAVS